MSLFHALNVSATGLSAQKTRLDVLSNNIANASTTRTPEGTPFKKSIVVFRPKDEPMTMKSPFLPQALKNPVGSGVIVAKITKDTSEGRLVYDPTHVDAYKFGPKKGYVEMPNVDVVSEMVDLLEANRAYEANITIMNTAKNMFQSTLNIGA